MARAERIFDRNECVNRARALRRSLTLPEAMLWQVLRARPHGLKFRRQHPIPPFVVDFCCPAAKLVVEVDGISHDMGSRPQRDIRRDADLRERGFQVLRLNAEDVTRDLESALTAIFLAARR